jgi:hypothetical protein
MITIDHTKVTADQTGFPLLVSLVDADLASKAQSDGDDIYFTAADGTTKLSHEIESYNSSTLTAWVKTDLLSSTDTVIYMYYGNANATNQEDPENVWDSNYLSVHHLEETSGNVFDSTSKHKDGTPLNGVTQNTAGKIDGGDQFDGADDRISLPRIFTTETKFTIEGWVNSNSKQGYIVSQRDTAGTFIQYYPGENNFQLFVNTNTLKVSATANACIMWLPHMMGLLPDYM